MYLINKFFDIIFFGILTFIWILSSTEGDLENYFSLLDIFNISSQFVCCVFGATAPSGPEPLHSRRF